MGIYLMIRKKRRFFPAFLLPLKMHLLFLLLSCRQQTDGLRNLLCLFPTYFTRHKSNADIYFQFCIIRQDTNRIQLWYFCICPGMVIQFLRIKIPDIRYPCFSRIRSINRGIGIPEEKRTTALRKDKRSDNTALLEFHPCRVQIY